MDDKTLEALKGSIAKWEAIVAETNVDEGTSNCPLCQIFMKDERDCKGCPVVEKVKLTGCSGTPYVQWSHGQVNFYQKKYGTLDTGFGHPYKIVDEFTRVAAQEELDFLRSLLPESK